MVKKTRRVCLDSRFLQDKPHGIAAYIYHLAKGLTEQEGIELVLLVNKKSPLLHDPLFSSTEKIITRFGKLSIAGIFFLFPTLLKNRIEIFHSPSFFITWLPTKIKRIITIHDLIHLKFPPKRSFFYQFYYQYLLKNYANKADKIITVSENSALDLREWLKTENIEVIYPGISSEFTPCLGLSDLFHRYQTGRNFILFVGNQRPHKNLFGLLFAYRDLKEKYPDFPCLVVISDADETIKIWLNENFLSEDVKLLSNVPFDDLLLLYSQACFLVFPSLYEGFGFPPAEAMACGCPVVCSSASSLQEVCGSAALYFDPADSASISSAMEKMYFDSGLRSALSEAGKKQVKNFNWKKVAVKTAEVYRQI